MFLRNSILLMICLVLLFWLTVKADKDVRTAHLDFGFINLGLSLTASTNLLKTMRDNQICDSYIIFKAKDDIFTLREKPRGSCPNCCPMKDSDFRMMLYTKNDPDRPKILRSNSKATRHQRSLEEDVQTIVYVHGFMELAPGVSGMAVKNAYLSRNERYNVIILDWSKLVSGPWYLEAVENVKEAGKILAKFLEEYNKRGEINMSKLHLIGFSLGAHVVGFAGKYLGNGLRVKRITGLDPAFPGFSTDPSNRISNTDAEFVDIIHTDGHRLGYPHPLGDVDFYPNGDERFQFQPGCRINNLQNQGALHDLVSCSHLRAWKYYAESVRNPEAFLAERCLQRHPETKICEAVVRAYMGFAANKNDTGTFYVKTRSEPPYGLNNNLS